MRGLAEVLAAWRGQAAVFNVLCRARARRCSEHAQPKEHTFFTTSSMYGFSSSVRYAPTPRFSLSGLVSRLNASANTRSLLGDWPVTQCA